MFDKEKADHFWNWFKNHHEKYLDPLGPTREQVLYWGNEMSLHLWHVCPGLGFEIAGYHPPERPSLTISCQSRRRYFGIARALVAAAPPIPLWEISALRQPTDMDFFLDMHFPSFKTRPESLRFGTYGDEKAGSKLEYLVIYFPEYRKEDEDLYMDVSYFILENLLGEETLGSMVGTIITRALDDEAMIYHAPRPITELPAYIDQMKSGYIITPKGAIRKGKV
jgi:hypothetical protein